MDAVSPEPINMFHAMALEMALEFEAIKRRLAYLENGSATIAEHKSSDPDLIREDDVLHAVRTNAVVSVLRKMGGYYSGEVHFITCALKESALWEQLEFKNGHSLAAFLKHLITNDESPIGVTHRKRDPNHRNPVWTLTLRDQKGTRR